ncbi:MAG: hypothetical protein JXL97_00085 [Bacteroidales bacterium]|nr:hypothetical protein [Bacteroidales bacterium]
MIKNTQLMFQTIKLIAFCGFIFLNISLFSQTILQTKVTIPKNEYKVDEILNVIEQNSEARFSYNSEIIENKDKITYQADNQEIENCLIDVLGENFRYQASGKYIVILKNREEQKESKKKIVVQGQIKNENDDPIANVSIFDIDYQYATMTNDEGEFSITVPEDYDGGFSVGKYGYIDTVILYDTKINKDIQIELQPRDSALIKQIQANQNYNNIDNTNFVDYFIPKKILINAQNLKHIEGTRAFQISFLPGISSNLSKFGVLKNKVSVNVLIGYTRGVEGFEMAGLMNFDKEDVEFVQLAGLSNMVGGNVRGLQIGGIANAVLGDVNACQLGGISNFVKGDFDGFQAGGILNMNIGNTKGVQIGGISNFNIGTVDGIQAGGITNIVWNNFTGTQIGGILNLVKGTVDGIQIAGILNGATNDVTGGQISGILNVSKSSNFQISGILNTTLNNKGIQIAPFNYADTSSGVSIGFFSFVRKGYNNVIISANEIYYLNLSAHFGTEKFYNIFNIGYQPANEVIWGLGYGFGHKFRFNDWAKLDLELMAKTLNYNTKWNEDWFPYYKLSTVFDFKIKKTISLYLGPSINLYVWNKNINQESLDYLARTMSYQLFQYESSNLLTKSWIGFYIGIGL